jgi:hypothetical protein
MVTPFEEFINAELPKRVSIEVPAEGNLDAGLLLQTTGVGLGVQLVTLSGSTISGCADPPIFQGEGAIKVEVNNGIVTISSDAVEIDTSQRIYRHVKDSSQKHEVITMREWHEMKPQSKRYTYPMCTVREYFKMAAYTPHQIVDWVELLLGPGMFDITRVHFYIEDTSGNLIPFTLKAGGIKGTVLGILQIMAKNVDGTYACKLLQGSIPEANTSSGCSSFLAMPMNGDRPRTLLSKEFLSGDLWKLSFHSKKPTPTRITSWDVGNYIWFEDVSAGQLSFQSVKNLGSGTAPVGYDLNVRNNPKAFSKSVVFPKFVDPGYYPNTASYSNSTYSERSRIFVSVDIFRSHIPVLVKTVRLRDVLWFDTDGGDFPPYVVEYHAGADLNEISDIRSNQWFNGMPAHIQLPGIGLSRVRFVDLSGISGNPPGGNWLWHGKPLRTLLVSWAGNTAKFINFPVGLQVVVPTGYYPLLVSNPYTFSTNNVKISFGATESLLAAGAMTKACPQEYFIVPCNPYWRLGQPEVNFGPINAGMLPSTMYFYFDYRWLGESFRFKRFQEEFRFWAIDKRGIISENSDVFTIKKFRNFLSLGDCVPVVYRNNRRC